MIRFKDMRIKGGFVVKPADPYGGKAGKGKNVTSTVQVWRDGQFLKHFVYQDSAESLIATIEKAKAYIETDPRPFTRATMLMPELYRATLYVPGKPKRVLHKHQVEALGLYTSLNFGMRHLTADNEKVAELFNMSDTGPIFSSGDTSGTCQFAIFGIQEGRHPNGVVEQNTGARSHLRRLAASELTGKNTPYGEVLIIEKIVRKSKYAE